MARISRWREFPKMTILATILVAVPSILFIFRPETMFSRGDTFMSAILMLVMLVGVGVFIVLTYLIERRKKYALVSLVFGIFFLLFALTLLLSLFN